MKTKKRYKVNYRNCLKLLTYLVLIIYGCYLFINSINSLCKQYDNDLMIKTFAESGVDEITSEIETETLKTELVINIDSENEVNYDETTVEENKVNYDIKPSNLDNEIFEIIVDVAAKEDMPVEVILAIITTENVNYDIYSNYTNTNGTTDMGLCQINSAYVDYYSETYNIVNLNPYDVHDSVTFVARHMKYLSNYAIEKYDLSESDSYIFAAGAYNRGLSNECKYRNMYHYKEKFVINYEKFI